MTGDEQNTPRYDFIYDATVRISADSKEEADELLTGLEWLVDDRGFGLAILDAYGIEDAITGEEIRPFG